LRRAYALGGAPRLVNVGAPRRRPVDDDLTLRHVAVDDDSVEIELVRAKRRMAVEIVSERLFEILLDGGGKHEPLAQHLRRRKRHDDTGRRNGPAVRHERHPLDRSAAGLCNCRRIAGEIDAR
jgi:hypothetical protein